MTYRDLNSNRFFYLLAQGTHEGELKRFFKESKVQLILKQAKVQNLPYGRMERIRALCERLPRSTDDITRNWFHKNVTMTEPTPVEDVLSDFVLYEQMGEPIPGEHGKQLARSALVHLFGDNPTLELIAFLKSRLGDSTESELPTQLSEPDEAIADSSNVELESRVDAMKRSERAQQLAGLLTAVIIGEETAIDEALAPYDQNIKTMVDALMSARSGNVAVAASLAKTLDTECYEYKLLQGVLSQARHRPGSTTTTTPGLRVVVPQPLKSHSGIVEFDVVGVCSNEAEKVVFVRPLGLVIDGGVCLLTAEERVRLFPESGDVMSFRAVGRRLPQRGEIVRWVVEERDDAGGKTRFHYAEEPCPMVEVINVPFPSAAPDEVRHYVKDLMVTRKSVTPPYPLFALADGVTIAPPKSSDPRRDDAYEQPWQSWSSLEAWLLEGRQFSMGIPQVPASQLDLSPLEVAFKKLVKNVVEEQKVTITKTQIRDLAGLIRSQPMGELRHRAARVADALNQVALDAESLEALLPVLVAREEVQRRVGEIVERNVAEKLKERAGLTTELEVLRNKNDEFQRESRELERRIRKRRVEVEASVAQVFSRAIDDGVAALAQAEIFRVLSGSNDRSAKSAVAEQTTQGIEVQTKRESLTRDEGIARLVAVGTKRRHAVVLTLLAQLMAKAGGCLVLRGKDARQLVRILGQIDSAVSGFVEIPMGLTSSAPLRKALAAAEDLEAIVVLDADLSPIEVYGSPLLDVPFDAAIDGHSTRTRLLFSCMGGDMALPLPSSIRRVAVVVDLDSSWDQQELLLSELEEDVIPLIKPVYASLVTEVGRLQGAERNLVENVLAAALQASK